MRLSSVLSTVLLVLLFSGTIFAAVPIAENLSITGYQSTDNLSASWDTYDGDAEDVRNFTVWSLNGDELPVLYVPFEGSSNTYNATDYAGNDNSGSGVSLTPVYNSTGGYDGYGAYEFDTSNEEVSLSTTNFPTIGTGNYTMMAWIKTAGVQAPYSTIFSINSYDPGFYVYTSNYLAIYDSGNILSSYNDSIDDGTWHHVAFVREGTGSGGLKFYLDGRTLGTNTHSSSIPSASDLRIGFDGFGGENFYGTIDDVRFYDYALSAEQVGAFANNESNKIVSSMTSDGQNWSICVTPNDGGQDGTPACSSNTTIGISPKIPVSACQEISSSGEYALTTDLSGANISGSCIDITASDITLDCQGYGITNNGTGGLTHGILLNGTSNVSLINCSSVQDYSYGVRLVDTDDVTIDPSYFCDNGYGISLDNSNNTNIDDSIACNNSVAGIYVLNSVNTSITNSVMYNNSDDFKIIRSISAGMPLLMSNVTFDNPEGNRRNYTNIDLNDTLSISNEDYVIDWTSEPASAPSGYESVKDKYLNITSSTSMSIDSITWNYLDGDAFGFDESSFRIYGHNGASWSNAGATLNTTANTLERTSVSNEYVYGLFGNQTFYTEDVYGCVEITSPGYYTTQNDVTVVGALTLNQSEVSVGCIIISADDVTLDCQNYYVASGSAIALVAVNGSSTDRRDNITIMDCELNQGAYPLYANFMENSTVQNITALNAGEDGIRIYNSFNSTLANSTSHSNSDDGISVDISREISLLNNRIYSNNNVAGSAGLRITYPDSLTINDNRFYDNSYDLMVEPSNSGSSSYQMRNSLFLPPSGNLVDYTNLSINDTMPAFERPYYINWSESPGSRPSGLFEFEDKFIDIEKNDSAGITDPAINSLVWHYLQYEVSANFYNEASMGVWKYNGSWSDTSDTLDQTNNELSLSSYTPGSTYGIFAQYDSYEIDSCRELDQSRLYILTDSLSGAGTDATPISGSACLKITADNAVLDCDSYTISGTAQASPSRYGILTIDADNVTVKNCEVIGYTWGYFIDSTTNSVYEDNKGRSAYDSVFYLDPDSAYNIFQRNDIRRAGSGGSYAFRIRGDYTEMYDNIAQYPIGIWAQGGLHGTYINNTLNYTSYSGYGFYNRLSYYNKVEDNTIYNHVYGVYSSAGISSNYTNNTIYNIDDVCINLTSYSVSGSLLNRVRENNLSNCGLYGISMSEQANGNTIIDNDISSVATAILIEANSDSNTINGHTIDSVTTTGIEVKDASCSGTTINYNTIDGIPTGILIDEASYSAVHDNTIHGASSYGIRVLSANLTNLSRNHMYNNANDVYFYTASSSPTVHMRNMIFDNAAGNYQNYSNVSLADTMSTYSGYYIDWSSNASAPPFTSFNNKYVNITTSTGSVSIDGLSFGWKDSEEIGYDEANLEIWKYNGTWSKLSSTVDLINNNISTTGVNPQSTYAVLEGLGSGCKDITAPGTYSLTFDASGAPYPVTDISYVDTACIRIRSDHVRFHCNGYSITNSGAVDDAAAIAIYGNTSEDYSNVTIENCDISDYEIGIALHQSAGGIIRNVTISNITGDIAQAYGIWSYNTSDSQLYNLTVTNSSWDGIRTSLGTNNTLYDNIVTDNYRYGIYAFGGSNFSFYDSYLSDNGDSGLYLNVPSSSVYNNVLYSNDGTGMTIQSAGNEVHDNVVNASTGGGFYVTGNNNNMTNNSAYSNGGTGFQLSYADNVSISNATSHSNAYGMSLSSVYNTTLDDVHFYNNVQPDFRVFASSDGDDFYVARNLTFDQNAGDFTYDTHLYINDTLTNFDESYTIAFDTEPATPPALKTSFDGKYVNISAGFATVSIDNITWKWEDGEIGSEDESEFELWKWNGSWSNTGAALDTGHNELSLTNMNPESTYGILEDLSGGGPIPVTGCVEISSSGTYEQSSPISATTTLGYDYEAPYGNISSIALGPAFDPSQACIIINASHVIFDCKDNEIDWESTGFLDSGAGIAIVPAKQNVTIQNCPNIKDFGFGVYSLGNDDVDVINVTVNYSKYAFTSSRTRFSSSDCSNNNYLNVESKDAGINGASYEPGAAFFSLGCINVSYTNSSAYESGDLGTDYGAGLRMDDPQNVTASNVTLYDNDWDVWARQKTLTGTNFNLSDLYILPDSGALANYTRLSIQDELGNGGPDYYIDYSAGADLPVWLKSFESKYVELAYNSNGSEAHHINSTIFYYTQPEVDGEPYNESLLDVYRFDEWLVFGLTATFEEELDATLNTSANTLTLTDFTPSELTANLVTSTLGIMEEPIPITGCQNITSGGRYRFVNNITGVQSGRTVCMDIQADDVVLFFDGYNMTGPAGFDVGIQATGRHNITIKGAGGTSIRHLANVGGYTIGVWQISSRELEIDPIYFCNNTIGILLNQTNDTLINDTIACNNSDVGIYLLDSDNITIVDSKVYNNTVDLKVNNTLGTPVYLNMTSLIFDRPQGDNTSFTNMTINDSVAAGEAYQINWTTNSTDLPSGYSSFADKFVEISNLTSSVSIDEIIWRWNETEITGSDNESNFELWKWNGTWSDTSAALDTGNNTLTLTNMNPASDYGILQTSVSTCMLITSPGEYTLTNNVSGAPYAMGGVFGGASNACIGIASSNVTFDCDGFNITNNGTSNAAGIIVNSSLIYPDLTYDNITIQNCPLISSYTDGIVLDQINTTNVSNTTVFNYSSSGIRIDGRSSFPTNKVVIDNVDLYNGSNGVLVYYGSDINITNSRAWNNDVAGIKCEDEYVDIIIDNYTAFDNGYGVHLSGPFSSGTSSWANVYNSDIYGNTYGFYAAGSEGPAVTLGDITIENTTFHENTNGVVHRYNTDDAFGFFTSATFTMENVSINSSSAVGAELYRSNVTANNLVFANNTVDVKFTNPNNFAPINHTLDMDMVFLNPSGTYENYTNLSLDDIIRDNQSYQITWTSNSSPIQSGYNSFEQKFVNITSLLNETSIDSAVWRWNDTESSGHDESSFGVWKYNGSWSDTGATLNTGANTLTLTNFNPESDYGILESDSTGISSCQIISTPGNYILTADLTGAPISASELGVGTHLACIKIVTSGVNLDCAGRSISEGGMNDDWYTYAVLLNGSSSSGVLYRDNSVENCVIDGYYTGMYVRNTRDSSFNNNIIENSTGRTFTTHFGIRGISFNFSASDEANNTFMHNVIREINGTAIDSTGNGNTTYFNNTLYGFKNNGFSITDGYNTIERNNASTSRYSTFTNAFDIGGNNNNVYNNTASNVTGNGFNSGQYLQLNNFTWNIAFDNARNGFDIETCDNYTLRNNTAHDNERDGFYIHTSGGGTYHVLENNTAYLNEMNGFHIAFDPNAIMDINYAYNNTMNGFLLNGTYRNNLTGNLAVENTMNGFRLIYGEIPFTPFTNGSNYNRLIDNNASLNGMAGINISNSSHNFIDPSYLCNNAVGVAVEINATNNTIQDSIICNNTDGGMNISNSSVILIDNQFYNNSEDANIYDFYIEGVSQLNMSSNLFLNVLGTLANYTNLSINDSVGSGESYILNWTTNSTGLPTNHDSFEQKFIEIDGQSGSTSIDSIVWHWTDSEAAAYTESNLELWKYNGSWSDTGATLNAGANTLSLTSMNPESIYGILEDNTPGGLTNCPIISSPGVYTMTEDFSGAPNDVSELGGGTHRACVKIVSSDVVFDCDGYTIDENNTVDTTQTYGVLTNGSNTLGVLYRNVTVKNCDINGYMVGAYIRNTRDSFVLNNNISNSTGPTTPYGIRSLAFNFSGTEETNNLFAHNRIWDIEGYGISSTYSGNCTFYNNTIWNFSWTGISMGDNYQNVTANYIHSGSGSGPNQAGFNIQSSYATVHNNTARNITGDGFASGGSRTLANYTENVAYNNSGDGFDFSGVEDYTIANNSAHGNAEEGFFVYSILGGSDHYLYNNTAENNSRNGFHVQVEARNVLERNRAFNNSLSGILLNGSHYANLSNNTAIENGQHGFALVSYEYFGTFNSSDYARLLDNNATGNTLAGLAIINSSHAFVDPSYFCGNLDGIVIHNATNITVLDSVLCNNTGYGLNISLSNVTHTGNSLYNNGHDFVVDGASTHNMSGNLFLNPVGTLVNYTNLSINDSVAAADSYTINWTSNSTGLPNDYISFEQKFVNISTFTGTPSIDSAVWSWTSAEASGYDESRLELWKWNGSWSNTSATLDTGTHTLTLTNMNPASDYGILQYNASAGNNITECTVISAPGFYQLAANLEGAPHSASPVSGTVCVKIAASNVEVDCDGYTITNNGTSGATYGILANGSLENITVRNCPGVSQYRRGVSMYQTNYTTITNSTAYNNTQYGFYYDASSHSSFTDNTAYDNTASGFMFYSNTLLSTNHTITDNLGHDNGAQGFELNGFFRNSTIEDNIAENNTGHGIATFSANYNNFTNNTVYNNTDGFRFVTSNNNRIDNNNASRNEESGFHSINPTSNNNNYTDNLAIENRGHGFEAASTSNNRFIDNLAQDNSQSGFSLTSMSTTTMQGNNATSNSQNGFYLVGSSLCSLIENLADENTFNGFVLNSSSNSNTLYQNIAFNNTIDGFYIYSSTGNNLTNNTANAQKEEDGFFATINAHNNNFTRNRAYNNDGDGFSVFRSSNATFVENIAHGQTSGFDLNNAANTVMIDDTSYSNSLRGVSVANSNTEMNGTTLYNNGHDLYADSFAGLSLEMNDVLFLNPSGTLQNYTNLSVSDTMGSTESFTMNWTTNSSALPVNYTSFEEKFINISTVSGTVSIDSISWGWTDAEALIYNESALELWKWNGSWSNTGATLNTGANTLSLTSMNPASDYGIMQNGSVGQEATLVGADVNETDHGRYNESSYAGNASTAGGNFTGMNLNSSQLTDRWAALYGTFDGTILLTDAAGVNNVYSWIWNASAGGVVCVTTNSTLSTFTVYPAAASDIDSAWSFTPSASDSAANTFDQSNCTLDIGSTSIPNSAYADTGLGGGYITCAAKTVPTPAKQNLLFCAEIEEDGPIWNGDSGDFEVIVPTPIGIGTTETYYFYVNLD